MQGQGHCQVRKQARKLAVNEKIMEENVNLLSEQIPPRVFSWNEAMYARPRTLSGKEASKKAGSMEEMSTYFVSRYHQGYFPGMRQCMQDQGHSQVRKQARKQEAWKK